MSISSTTNSWYNTYAVPSMAASCALVPSFYGLQVKSAQQVGDLRPRISWQILKQACKAVPIIGAQVFIQRVVEKALKQESGEPTTSTMVKSAAITGVLSVPAMAGLNGLTRGIPVMRSIRTLSLLQITALFWRESAFLASLRLSEPVSDALRGKYEDRSAVSFGSAFLTGVIGSLASHPGDTALTRLQAGKGVRVHHLMKGASVRAVTIGVFCVWNKYFRDIFQQK